jgi:hypothetical protein
LPLPLPPLPLPLPLPGLVPSLCREGLKMPSLYLFVGVLSVRL